MKLAISINAERRKQTTKASLYFAAIMLLILSGLVVFDLAQNPRVFQATGGDPWASFFQKRRTTLQFLGLPFFVILLTAMFAQLEYKNNTWKQVHCSPQSNLQISLSKLIVLQCMILLFVLCYHILMMGILILADAASPQWSIGRPPNWQVLLSQFAQANLSIAATTVFQFWLAYHFRNFIVSVGVGFFLWIAGAYLLFEARWTAVEFFPHSFPMLLISERYQGDAWTICLRSLGYAVGFFWIGQLIYNNRSVRT